MVLLIGQHNLVMIYDDKYVHRYDKHFKENDFNR